MLRWEIVSKAIHFAMRNNLQSDLTRWWGNHGVRCMNFATSMTYRETGSKPVLVKKDVRINKICPKPFTRKRRRCDDPDT
jgi:hypothetical protein